MLFKTKVKTGYAPRPCYLKYRDTLPPPYIAHSSFVPKATVEFLMRIKKDAALGSKFRPHDGAPQDRITNMEGALHTFVIPTVLATMHGDYRYKGGHGATPFGSRNGYQLGRKIIVSALVQQDFEFDNVMLKVAALGTDERIGRTELPKPITTMEKQQDTFRRAYDDRIRDFLIFQLTHDHRLPAVSGHIQETAFSIGGTLDFLAKAIEHVEAQHMPKHVHGIFFNHRGHFISLEVIFNTAVHQIRNEMLLLERLNKEHGYVYTFNPPRIFVQFFGSQGTELLARIHVAALKYVAGALIKFEHCKIYAWADFDSPKIVGLIRYALASQPWIRVMCNDDLFSGKSGTGLYSPPNEAKRAMIVVHNNSDAFGQNIETESDGGSLDGVYGTWSSASGSLMRDRKDLCSNLFEVKPVSTA